MKINMPVTNQEILMKKGAILVTRTDLKGVITYANDEFVRISGFSHEELIGVEHNIVRHPDMPAAVFEDLWMTTKKLRPWQGLIKNRTKSGDYYWAEANVIPVFKNGKVHEYLSVRRIPNREKIEQAEQLYCLLNDNKTTIKPTGLAAVVKSIKEIDAGRKMAVALVVLLIPLYLYDVSVIFSAGLSIIDGCVSFSHDCIINWFQCDRRLRLDLKSNHWCFLSFG